MDGDLSLGMALSQHMLPGDWNERHPYVRYETPKGWAAGAFRNSEGDLSLTGGRVFRNDDGWFLDMGLATGYEAAPVVPFVRGGYEKGPARVFVAPAATKNGDIGGLFGLEIDLWSSR